MERIKTKIETVIQIEKEDLKNILKEYFKVKSVKIETIDYGEEYNQRIDDSTRPLTINILVERG